ncbi:Hypothetical_protein [Hexamita inflata]|uniref:Hypothetical_protein n=1 Tax=Hexamita inflata TaxID=28002 RepID=A0AA86VG34_9EUKA|nr:Hypothetical protein HINF_LOCUS53343 [Hexamita inflata]
MPRFLPSISSFGLTCPVFRFEFFTQSSVLQVWVYSFIRNRRFTQSEINSVYEYEKNMNLLKQIVFMIAQTMEEIRKVRPDYNMKNTHSINHPSYRFECFR